MEEDACGLKVALCNMPSDHYKTSRECSMTGKSNVSFCVMRFAQQLLIPSLSESVIAILILGLMWSVFGRSLVLRGVCVQILDVTSGCESLQECPIGARHVTYF